MIQLNRNDIAPKYLQIYEYLHGMIRRNRIVYGDKLPTEMALAEKFNVTRMTVRKALDRLVVEEMVVRKRGQGTFLISKMPKEFIYGLDITTGFFKDVRNYGLNPHSKTLLIDVKDADQRIAELLELTGDNPKVISMLRIFYADGEPLMIERNFMSHDEFGDLMEADLSGLRYPVLKDRYNIIPHHANQTFKAVLCDPESMKFFDFSAPEACLELEFVLYDASNVPIEVGYYLFRGDRYKFNINAIEYLID
jgi:GntR family transcriptional regulator